MNLNKIFQGFLLKRIIFQQFGFFDTNSSASNQQSNTRIEKVTITRYNTKFASNLNLDSILHIQKIMSDIISIKY